MAPTDALHLFLWGPVSAGGRNMKGISKWKAGFFLACLLAGCGGESGEGRERSRWETERHYPDENAFDSAREGVPAMPVPMDTAIRRAPEAGNRLDAGGSGIIDTN